MTQLLLEPPQERDKVPAADPQTSLATLEVQVPIPAQATMSDQPQPSASQSPAAIRRTAALAPRTGLQIRGGTFLSVAALFAYPLVFVPLFHVFGSAVGALYFLPSVAVAWRFGTWGGVIVAAAGLPINQLLFTSVGFAAGVSDVGVLIATAANLTVAAFVGRVRGLQVALRRSEERFRLIAATSSDVIWDYDPKTETVWVISRFGGFGNGSGAAVPKSAWLQRVHPDDVDRVQAEAAAHLAAGADEFSQEYRLARDHGSWADVMDRAHVFRGPTGRVERIVGTMTDTTTRRVAEREHERRVAAEQAVQNLREVDAFKTQLLNTASHELNTPISALRLQLYLLELEAKKDLSSPLHAATRILNRNVDRLSTLVRDTLDVARLRSGKLELRVAPFRLDDLVAETTATFRPLAAQMGQELKVETEPGVELEADHTRLSQVVYNLLSNAIKFSPAGGAVTLRSTRMEGGVRITVQDSGIGMTPDQIQRLFQPFSRVHDEKTVTVKGTGLGLYISHVIVTRHGGRLWCESPGAGKGTVFHLELPLKPRATPPQPEAT